MLFLKEQKSDLLFVPLLVKSERANRSFGKEELSVWLLVALFEKSERAKSKVKWTLVILVLAFLALDLF